MAAEGMDGLTKSAQRAAQQVEEMEAAGDVKAAGSRGAASGVGGAAGGVGGPSWQARLSAAAARLGVRIRILISFVQILTQLGESRAGLFPLPVPISETALLPRGSACSCPTSHSCCCSRHPHAHCQGVTFNFLPFPHLSLHSPFSHCQA